MKVAFVEQVDQQSLGLFCCPACLLKESYDECVFEFHTEKGKAEVLLRENLREDPRFDALAKRIGIPE
jgi:hypothetical protein